MSGLMDRIADLKQSGEFHRVAEAIPYAQFAGISVDDSGGDLLGKLCFSEMLIGNALLPALHGGTIGALLESTAVLKLLWDGKTVVVPKTINITVSYLRSAKPVDTYAKAVVTKQGRRVVNVRIDAWQEDPGRLVATANAQFLVIGSE